MLFTFVPMASSFYFSFTKYDIFTPPRWIGLDNFVDLFTDDPDFYPAFKNTFIFLVFRVLLGTLVPLLLALLLNKKLAGKNVFRTLIYLPAILPAVGAALLWQFMFSSDFGLFNYVLESVGADRISWLDHRNAMMSILIMSIWSGVGPTMIILLAALQGVPQSLYEAADIDGASPFRKLINVTIPLISPTLFYVVIIGMIGAFQVYAEPKLLTNGGPAGATTTLSMIIFNSAYNQMGYASAIAWIVFLCSIGFIMLAFRYIQKMVHYEGGNR